ncbi:MAG: hypothetical protein KDB40_04695 [Acidimicrobiales bacterium]|nr:hypothetical protein [Acidimicrobiales bacterium]MCB9395981.1 hypothetical protein [Acidimicrobiaceae bacterium]
MTTPDTPPIPHDPATPTPPFPAPRAADDRFRVYVSVGHQQMMTEAMRPFGRSLWQMVALRPMDAAGGRLFVDITDALASPTSRAGMIAGLGTADPLIGDALTSIVDAGLVGTIEDGAAPPPPPVVPGAGLLDPDPELVARLVAENEDSVGALATDLAARRGADVFDAIVADLAELRRLIADPRSMHVITTGMEATRWLNERLAEWLGAEGVADVLTRSAPGNVTSEMGLALLDVADVVRPHTDVVARMRDADDGVLERLNDVPGGSEVRRAIAVFLERYGMRCVGEIDITRTRWAERPSTLVPVILGHVEHEAPGAAQRRFETGRRAALDEARSVLDRLRTQPGGEARAAETAAMIERVRTFVGYREYPKYGIVRRLWCYKQAVLRELDRLVATGVLREVEDAWYLTFAELHEVLRTGEVDHALVHLRREEHLLHERLVPPRVLTSDGRGWSGDHRRDDVPANALAGVAVSTGLIEGRARVVLDLDDIELAPGDILVTTGTDPSWTPLFVAAAGLVTEVGGPMTHGAVVAREYGLPAVVGVQHATRLISDGSRIRVDGTTGLVHLLDT